MQEILQEITNTPRRNVRIDRDDGVLFGVKIIGCISRNGRRYPNETLREAIHLYENSKVNLDHPEGDPRKPRSYQDRFGVIRNVKLRENDGLYADFRFNPKHPVAEQLLWDAQHAPENVGFSHNVEAIVRRDDEKTVVERIVAVRSVDLVADPATTAGLFEQTRLEQEQRETAKEVQTVTESKVDERLSRFEETLVEIRDILLERKRNEVILEAKPVSREQFVPEKPLDVKTFVKLLKR